MSNNFKSISFVNGIYTSKNGHHVDHVFKPIIKGIKSIIESKFKTDCIKDSMIRDQLGIFVSASIENPTFSSQIKEEL
ncbi:MAG: hypothetical protein JKX98_11130, partial [Alcanivoracaceae bacterium]|nr:hypothetical protein [Alcanivoracaceae bacterium]